MSYGIPIVNFSKCGLLVEEEHLKEEDINAVGIQLYSVLSTAGFTYLTDHGIPWSKVDEINEIAEKFYSLPESEKMLFNKRSLILAYDPIGGSKADTKELDHYEGFRTADRSYADESIRWPNVQGLKETYFNLAETSAKLLMRVLRALGHGMKLKDKDYFCRAHSRMNRKGNLSTMKTLKYPPIKDDDPSTNHRLGEHTDKTAMTLLFLDQMGGLQVRDLTGNFVDVEPLEGAIVVNIGDTLEAWSGGRLKSTKHRVCPPSKPENRGRVRRSVVFFGQANSEVLMENLQFEDENEDGNESGHQKPPTVKEYMERELGILFYSESEGLSFKSS